MTKTNIFLTFLSSLLWGLGAVFVSLAKDTSSLLVILYLLNSVLWLIIFSKHSNILANIWDWITHPISVYKMRLRYKFFKSRVKSGEMIQFETEAEKVLKKDI